MKRFGNILLIVDEQTDYTAALKRGLTLAKNNRARLTICAIVDTIPSELQMSVIAITPREVLDVAGLGALLHDLGKMKVPTDVLNKPGKLTKDEFEAFEAFCHAEAHWLEGYARYTALKRAHDGAGWTGWGDTEPDPDQVARIEAHLADNEQTRREVEKLRRLKNVTGALRLKEPPPEHPRTLVLSDIAGNVRIDSSLSIPAGQGGGRQGRRYSQEERAAAGGGRGAHIGADHVKRAMGQVDHLHDAEDQGQPGGHQKQHDAQLQAVEQLFDEQKHKRPPCARFRNEAFWA